MIEGDEYDTAFFDKRSKFVHYLPELVIVNNIEFDHADIFKDIDEIKLSFRRLLNIVPGNGMVLLNSDDPNCVDVGKTCPAPIVEVGFSENAANRIEDARCDADGSRFTLFGTEFHLKLSGQFQYPQRGDGGLRRALLRSAAAGHPGGGGDLRRGETAAGGARGEARHQGDRRFRPSPDRHPRDARRACAANIRGGRIWAVFEPRSNTTRRAVFQHELPAAFALADGAILAKVAKLEQIPEAERLHPEQVVADIAATGKPAFYEPDVEQIIARVKGLAQRRRHRRGLQQWRL